MGPLPAWTCYRALGHHLLHLSDEEPEAQGLVVTQ
jgi:hypothetical protein